MPLGKNGILSLLNPNVVVAGLLGQGLGSIVQFVNKCLPSFMKMKDSTFDDMMCWIDALILAATSCATIGMGVIVGVGSLFSMCDACAGVHAALHPTIMQSYMGHFSASGVILFCGFMGLEELVGLFMERK